jgi:leader peptidase (prepilin peptidase) / N-methyltransferase
MLPWIVAHPTVARLLVVLVSLVVAWFINWAIITQSYRPRAIGVWSAPPTGASRHSWLDWLPVLGWWRLRREARLHGDRFWLRPLLIEIFFPLAMLWLYNAHITGKLLPAERIAATLQTELHCQFVAYFVLIALMTVATFIDFDEQLIPDTITIPGTLFGLLGSASFAAWFPFIPFMATMAEMDAASLSAWPAWLDGPFGLAIALLIGTVWCFALLDRVWITRRGWARAPKYFLAIMFRSRWWIVIGLLWLLLICGIVGAWQFEISRWRYLLSALFGLACAGGITWAVRVAARLALQVEALGFGDVTLMAMIGVYLGWQPSLLVFFVAPLFAVLVFAARYLFTGNGAGPYGPYLCMAAVCVLVCWDFFRTTYASPILELPASVTFIILGVAVIMLGAMLWLWRLFIGTVHGLKRRS